jgi:hypothetical protein
VLFTGTIRRLEDRTAVWRSTWRCLHGGSSEVSAKVYIEGSKGPTRVVRRWRPEDKGYADGVTTVRVPGEPDAGMERLGWDDALKLFRPFLSHAELEVLLWEPSKLYDQLNNLLGLDELNTVAKRLGEARKGMAAVPGAAKAHLASLRGLLAASDDDRSNRIAALLKAKKPDLRVLQELAGGPASDDSAALATLSGLRAISVPSAEDVTALAARLGTAAKSLEEIGLSAAGDAAATARLLEIVIDHFHRHGPGPCPVCGRRDALDDDWLAETADRLSRLRAQADDLRRARAEAESAVRDARLLISTPPAILKKAAEVGVDAGDLTSAWVAWAKLPATSVDSPSTLDDLSRHLTNRQPDLQSAACALQSAATAEFEAHQDRWAPIAAALSAWIAAENAAQAARTSVTRIKRVETWLKAANDDLRNERFRPFAERTTALWSQLRQESNVDLVKMVLTGSNTSRAVDIQVTVDDQPAAGPGVMSQGEINALGLSVFLPRATSPDSPLRFVVVDDPVQAMDPSKVDGMAHVLSEVAADRQVVVFTHDDRLPDAVRNLQLPAHIIEVVRRLESIIELRQVRDPARALLEDAWKLAAGQDIPAPVTGRVVPGLCREALEEVCLELTRRHRLAAGASHDAIERTLADTTKLLPRLALGIFDDQQRAGEVYGWLNSHMGGRWAADLVSDLNKGSHGEIAVDSKRLVRETEELIPRLRERMT